jgi:hypothetical protein
MGRCTPIHSNWEFSFEQLIGLVVQPNTNHRIVEEQFFRAWDAQDRIRNPSSYFECAKSMTKEQAKMLADMFRKGASRSTLSIPDNFDIGKALALSTRPERVTGSEPFVMFLRNVSDLCLSEPERNGLKKQLAQLYPEACDRLGN